MTNKKKLFCMGAVVIGRNEGQRLVTCLNSLVNHVEHIIYVDSGSTDDSIQEARKAGVDTINLDLSNPFTAARARNEGAQYLIEKHPEIEFIQFIDGDCEIQADWIAAAYQFLVNNDIYAVACGRRRERYPEQSIYNQLCDIEWNTPIGDAMACGGDALVSVYAYKQVSGYRDDLIAGEEPEMCFRLRNLDWKIYRLDAEMTLHDAAIMKFGQWWKRTIRAGYAYVLGSSIHGKSKEAYWVREKQRIIFWGLALPFTTLILSCFDIGFTSLLLLYFFQVVRVGLGRKDLAGIRFVWASSVVLGKLPEAIGLLRFYFDRIQKNDINIIEYK